MTLAHLFWRGVATNAPALPFLPDWLYRLVFPSPKIGLTELGTAAARAMVRERVLVDITHMSEQAIADTFAAVGPRRRCIASHMACRFGKLSYNLTDDVIREVGRRGGVMGVIACTHYTHDGLRATGKVKTFEDSMELVFAHIDRVAQVTGSARPRGDRHRPRRLDQAGASRPRAPRAHALRAGRPGDEVRCRGGREDLQRQRAARCCRRAWR